VKDARVKRLAAPQVRPVRTAGSRLLRSSLHGGWRGRYPLLRGILVRLRERRGEIWMAELARRHRQSQQ